LKLGIVLPWRETEERAAGFEAALKRTMRVFPDVPIYKGDGPSELFNPSEARNRGCLEAIADGCEVLAVLDADTLFDPTSIRDAIEIATSKNIVCYPYETFIDLSISETDNFIRGFLDPYASSKVLTGKDVPMHVGSGWVMTAEMFKTMNGWDENFLGWGYEDTAFQEAHRKLLGKELERAGGRCFRLYHAFREMPKLGENRERFTLYEEATTDNIKELISNNLVHQRKQDESYIP
jgi:hypothetical protein